MTEPTEMSDIQKRKTTAGMHVVNKGRESDPCFFHGHYASEADQVRRRYYVAGIVAIVVTLIIMFIIMLYIRGPWDCPQAFTPPDKILRPKDNKGIFPPEITIPDIKYGECMGNSIECEGYCLAIGKRIDDPPYTVFLNGTITNHDEVYIQAKPTCIDVTFVFSITIVLRQKKVTLNNAFNGKWGNIYTRTGGDYLQDNGLVEMKVSFLQDHSIKLVFNGEELFTMPKRMDVRVFRNLRWDGIKINCFSIIKE